MFSFFTGRSSRAEYWISVALLIVVALVLSVLQMQAASAAITIMWIITWMRRLHDIGRPGWVALIPLVVIIAVIFGGIAYGGNDLLAALENLEKSGGAAIPDNAPLSVHTVHIDGQSGLPDNILYLLGGIVFVGLIIQFGFTIWLGAKKGDAGDNRFGPPPPPLRS